MGTASEGNWCDGASAWDQGSGDAPAPVLVACRAWLFPARDQCSGRRGGLGQDLRRWDSEATEAVGGLAALVMRAVGFGERRAHAAAAERPRRGPNCRWNHH